MKYFSKYIVGIDEVGRGPLAGPVTVCAVMCEVEVYKNLKRLKILPRLGKDSKKLREIEREKYCVVLKNLQSENKIFYSITHVSNEIIDNRGISFCIKSAIEKNIKKLKVSPKNSILLLDGSLKGPYIFNQKTIIKGDEKEKIIAWASILAKVDRDNLLKKLSKKYPEYNFSSNKGYGTKSHLKAINKHGVSIIHRKSYCKGFFK